MTTYGYARVSTNGQDLAAQEAELMPQAARRCSRKKYRVRKPIVPSWPR